MSVGQRDVMEVDHPVFGEDFECPIVLEIDNHTVVEDGISMCTVTATGGLAGAAD